MILLMSDWAGAIITIIAFLIISWLYRCINNATSDPFDVEPRHDKDKEYYDNHFSDRPSPYDDEQPTDIA